MSKDKQNDSICTDKLLDEADEMKQTIKNQEDDNDVSQINNEIQDPNESPKNSPEYQNVKSELKVQQDKNGNPYTPNTLDNIRVGTSIHDTFRTQDDTADKNQYQSQYIKDSTFEHDNIDVHLERAYQKSDRSRDTQASFRRNQFFNEENSKEMLNVNNQLKKIRLFKNTFSADSAKTNKLNTSTSTAAKSTTTTRDTEIKSLKLPRGKFKTDPYNSDPQRFAKRKDLDYKQQLEEEKQRDLADHFIRSIDKKRKFAYEQRQPEDLAIKDKKSKLGDELRPQGLTAPKLTQTTVYDKNVLNNIYRDDIQLNTRRNNKLDQQNIEVDEIPNSFKEKHNKEIENKLGTELSRSKGKKSRDEKLIEFEISKINKMMSDTKMSSLKSIKSTMSSTKFSKLKEKNAFDDAIDQNLTELKQTKSKLKHDLQLVQSGKYDPGYWKTFDEPSTISKIKYMDTKTFTNQMKEEEKTLDRYTLDATKSFGKTFKVSIDLKDTYKKKLGDKPLFQSRDDYSHLIRKANDEVLASYDSKKRPKSAESKFARKSQFEMGRGEGTTVKWVTNNSLNTSKPGRESKMKWLTSDQDGQLDSVRCTIKRVDNNDNKYLQHSGTVSRQLNDCFKVDQGITKQGFSSQQSFNKNQANVSMKQFNQTQHSIIDRK